MSPAKRFLLIFFGGAFLAWLALVLLFGPSGYSSAYMEGTFEFDGREIPRQEAHDEYLIIIKSLPYKLYDQRPHLHPPEPERDPEKDRAGIEHITEREARFVEAYEAQEAFQRENTRRGWFEFLYRALNVILIVILIWYFGRPPLKRWIEAEVNSERATLDEAAQARSAAEERLAKAQESVDNLPEEREQVAADTQAQITRELEQVEEANQQSLALARQEVEDRKRNEELAAAYLVKKELVYQSIDEVIERLRKESTPERQSAWLRQFLSELEHRSS
ncbi:MAG: hypothetical protein ACLFTT_06195 [Candidatus Hydrogenedentota bacterium]